MEESKQKIGFVWVVPSEKLETLPHKDFYSSKMYLYLSKDKLWWTADGTGCFSKGEEMDFCSKITEVHKEGRWERVRSYIIKNLLPTLEPPPLYNDLDRFSNLEV